MNAWIDLYDLATLSTPPATITPGDHDGLATLTYPDGRKMPLVFHNGGWEIATSRNPCACCEGAYDGMEH